MTAKSLAGNALVALVVGSYFKPAVVGLVMAAAGRLYYLAS
jgi:hypothetical protein